MTTSSLRNIVSVAALASLVQGLFAQDVLHYPFAAGAGNTVINLASGGPVTGTLKSANTTNSGWSSGRSGHALAGVDAQGSGSWVSSGWGDAVYGSFTVAFFIRESHPIANTLSYQFSGRGSFRMFTGGVAQEGLYCRAWGGAPADLVLPGAANAAAGEPFFDLRAAAARRWVHIALVVDSAALRATYYVDGSPFRTIPLTAGAAIAAGSDFIVGMHASAAARSQSLDDFRFSTRAAAAHEIQRWAAAQLQTDRTAVSIANGESQALRIDFGASTVIDFYLIVGSRTGTWPPRTLDSASIPLVPDAYTNLLLASLNAPVFTGFRGVLVNGQGTATFQPPANTPAAAIGLELYHTALRHDFSGWVSDATNAAPVRIVR